MEIEDFDGHASITTVAELLRRLKTVRKGGQGAFILWHEKKGPSFWIFVLKRVAYLFYLPDDEGKHPGFIPTKMSPGYREGTVRFLQVGGYLADAITVPREYLVPSSVAYLAAREFFRDPRLPPSVTWLEL